MVNVLCIYHGNCADGFTGAWVVRKFLSEDNPDAIVEYYPGFYGKPAPTNEYIAGRVVIMVDFSYPREAIIKMSEGAGRITIIDHHESAMGNLVDLPKNTEAVFDMERSGAGLAWDVLIGGPRPPLIDRVEDRDLFRFKFSDSRSVNSTLSSHEYTFENWDFLMNQTIIDLDIEGRSITRKHMKDIFEFSSVATQQRKIAGHVVPVINILYTYGSEATNILAKGKPFAAYYWDDGEYHNFGLRSIKDQEGSLNVSEIAKTFGGGGHAHASGFRIPQGTLEDTFPIVVMKKE